MYQDYYPGAGGDYFNYKGYMELDTILELLVIITRRELLLNSVED